MAGLVVAWLLSGCAASADLCRGLGPVSCGLFSMMQAVEGPRPHQPPRPPPQPGTCEDVQALLGANEPVRTSAYPRPVTHAWSTLRGFSVLPPSGDNWCEFASHRSSATGFAKIPGGEISGKHSLVVLAFLIHEETPFDGLAIRKMLRTCDGGGDCHIGQIREIGQVPAKCLSVSGYTEVENVVRQIHYACVHPADPHYVVKLVIAETFPAGEPYHGPSRLEALEPEYATVVKSLQFTAPNQ